MTRPGRRRPERIVTVWDRFAVPPVTENPL
jgi:hypothetical protein